LRLKPSKLLCVILTVVTITGKVEEEELFRQRFEPGIFLSACYTLFS
jgi:hypothetical protein